MRFNIKNNVLAMFLCIVLIINGSVFVKAAGGTVSSGDANGTVSSGDVLGTVSSGNGNGTVSSGNAQNSVSSGNAQNSVSSGDVLIKKILEMNARIQNVSTAEGGTDANRFELVLESWLTGNVKEAGGTVQDNAAAAPTGNAAGTEAVIDETAVLQNELSSYFAYDCNCIDNAHTCVQVYVASWDGSRFGEPVAVENPQISVDINAKTVSVTGFDYDEHMVINENTDGNGQKLIVKLMLKTATGFWGGNNVPIGEAAVSCNGQVEKEIPSMNANVPLSVDVETKDKTIYYGGSISAAELLLGVTAGYETVGTENGAVTVNADGTFLPAAEWMDDYAEITWDTYAGQEWSALSGSLSEAVVSNVSDDLYRYEITATSRADAADDSVGAAVPAEGITDFEDAGVYVLVPRVKVRNTGIYGGYAPDNTYFNTYNILSVDWVEMSFYTQENPEGDENPATYPAVDAETAAPGLAFTYEPVNRTFLETTKVKVIVTSTNDDKNNGIYAANGAVFFDANDNPTTNEFTVTVTYKEPLEMPATGGMGTAMFTYSGMALLICAALLTWKKKRS